MVRSYDVGISGRMRHLIANFLCGTQSQVRIGDSAASRGIALVDTFAASMRSVVLGVWLTTSDAHRHTCQLYAEDLVLLSESQIDLQAGLDACHAWAIVGASLLMWAQRSRPPWSSVPPGAALIVMFISEVLRSTGILASCLLLTLVGALSRMSPAVVTDCFINPARGAMVKVCPSVSLSPCSTRMFSRVLALDWSSWATMLQLLGIGDSLRLVLGRAFPLFCRLCTTGCPVRS